jgi:DNA topoisomerase-1
VRDLEKKNKGIDIENNFAPLYKVAEDKKDVVKELKKFSKDSETVWLATDEDREGEAISWHLKEVLKLKDEKIKRIVFHEITKKAITNAIANPRGVDQNLVDAQQARRILDRLVGFELSPVLWRKVKPSLSAGRVQSVTVRLVVEREREIDNFKPDSKFRVVANFLVDSGNGEEVKLSAELSKRFETEKEAEQFIKDCTKAEFKIGSLEKKPVKKSPAPPFTTSTLQQEASRKLGYSVAKTMLIAQKLYEAGNITYMRTDSVNLSESAIEEATAQITKEYGKKYSHSRKYKTKSASAQEAHEAIRPSYFEKETIKGGNDEQKLYQLIWKRAIASQMSDAQIERTIAKIDISNRDEKFTAQGEVIKFDGFLKVYIESTDDENGENGTGGILPPIKENQSLSLNGLTATERFSRASARYTEASLVKKLEELGIGRPSTYAPTISTVQRRGYVVKEDRPGVERKYIKIELDEKNNIKREELTEIAGNERNKLFPEDIGILVNDFLLENFPKIMDYKFTAHVEKELDDIANGELNYHEMLKEFYFPFHEHVEHTIENSERVSGERILGIDPKTKKQVLVRMARFGPVAQINDPNDEDDKPEYAGLRPGQKLESITLEEALELFKLPRTLGDYEDKTVVAAIGRFGQYVRHDGKFVSLGKEYDPHTVTLEEAIVLIEEKRKKDAEKHIKSFDEDPEMQILNGRWGPYIKAGKKNVRIPKDVEASKLCYEECVKLVEKAPAKKAPRKKKK